MSSPDLITSYLTYYVQSLAERSRVEKTGTKYGFEWIIYNLALAENWTPVRLPFLRAGGNAMSKTKTEGEFGVDLEFLSADRRELRIFVLKDEVLNNKNFTKHDFDADLRRAVLVDLRGKRFAQVRTVRVILAYNKDEDANGVHQFNKLVQTFSTKMGNTARLSVERWNLTDIVERIKSSLLNPSLLPQRFFSLFTYISAQAADMIHDSESWRQHVIPAWKSFLNDLLEGAPSERAVKLVPVALLILAQQGEKNASFATGYIDLMDWAVLQLWGVYTKAAGVKHAAVRAAVERIWNDFYLKHLATFYTQHTPTLLTVNALSICGPTINYLGSLGAAYIAFWHLGHLGLLAMALGEQAPANKKAKSTTNNTVSDLPSGMSASAAADLLLGLLNKNPAALRPMLDRHHVELFLVWNTLQHAGRHSEIHAWLQALEWRLRVRRRPNSPLPFLEGDNSLALVFEQAVLGKKPSDFMDKTSYLLTMLLELCFSLPSEADRYDMLGRIMRHLVLDVDDDGTIFSVPPIQLMGWKPPADWSSLVMNRPVRGGIGIALQPPETLNPAEQALYIEGSVQRSRQALSLSKGVPKSVHVLACLRHSCPLPPEFWRGAIFAPPAAAPAPPSTAKPKKKEKA